MAIAPFRRYSASRVEPAMRPELAKPDAISLGISTTFAQGAWLAEVTGTNAIQTVTVNNTPSAGTFTLTFNGYTTTPLAYNISAANMLIALQLLPSIDLNGCTVTLSGSAYTITFTNQQGAMVQPVIMADGSLLIGAGASVTVVNTTPGVTGSNGLFVAYNSGASDGTQNPKCILAYAAQTDANGLITWGDGTQAMDNGTQETSILAWFGGIFDYKDVPTTNGTILTAVGGHTLRGSSTARGCFFF